MKRKETLSNMRENDFEEVGNHHHATSLDTPLRDDAFEMDDELKMELIENHFESIMQILGLDLTDDSLKGTPHRVAKMFVKEVFSGLNPANRPEVKLFENKFNFDEMLIEKDITFYTHCEHHFVPFFGKAHVAYIPKGKVIGLSKINRIVQYYAKRPQVQERLTVQIMDDLRRSLQTDDVAVVLEADHLCVASRGVQDTNSRTITSKFSGRLQKDDYRKEFLQLIKKG